MSSSLSQISRLDIGYGYGRILQLPFPEALARAREVLKTEGFGVLCEIDIREKLREKLGVDFANYVILGVCNPPLAYQTLQQEVNIGLFLPCNVVVYEKDGKSIVAAVDAVKMLSVVGNPALQTQAETVSAKLRAAVDRL
jgi:uncharacterized protein (DUF302 family)